jgi:hypothetical protein
MGSRPVKPTAGQDPLGEAALEGWSTAERRQENLAHRDLIRRYELRERGEFPG